jgi:hypothetical protein
VRPANPAKALKRKVYVMTKEDNKPSTTSGNVVEHPRLKRDRAFALYKARCYAHNNGLPMPDPASIGPAVFTKIKPGMSREQQRENLIAALERMGLTVEPSSKSDDEEQK